jgi:hypothetical protein
VLLAGPRGFERGDRRRKLGARVCRGGRGAFRRTLEFEPAIEQQNARIVRFELERTRKLAAAARSRKRRAQRFEFGNET